MSNPNPDTSGLRPFNIMPRSESAQIQSSGRRARADKVRKLKAIREIIQVVRTDADTPTNATIKALMTFYAILGETPQ